VGNRQTGIIGEQIARNFLISKGHQIVETNFRFHKIEIDIIAKKDQKYTFVEVKTRVSIDKGKPYESVTYRKQLHLKKAAEFYVLKNNLKNYKLSIDVISIILNKDLSVKDFKHYVGI
jgi:putative endonuclease